MQSLLLELSMVEPAGEITTDTYDDILNGFCEINFGRTAYSHIVSDLIVTCMKLPKAITAHDEARLLIQGLGAYVSQKAYGPKRETWRPSEWEERTTKSRWGDREDAELLWASKTQLVCREEFLRRVRNSASRWKSEFDIDVGLLMTRIHVEESHLKTYLRGMPVEQAVSLLSRREASADVAPIADVNQIEDSDQQTTTRKPRKRNPRGAARAILISALLKHHRYDTDELRLAPIGGNQLAVSIGVAPSSATGFWKKYFGGYAAYEVACKSKEALLTKLRRMNEDDISPKSRPLRDPMSRPERDDE